MRGGKGRRGGEKTARRVLEAEESVEGWSEALWL